MWDVLNQGWVGALIGGAGALIGGAVTYFYRTSKFVPKPVYQSQSSRILGRDEDNLPEDVSIKFKDTVVDRLTRTTIIFWNDGSKVLDGSDIVKGDPLLISYPAGSKILSCTVRKQTKDAHKFRLTHVPDRPNKLSINFDYLDSKGGSACEIIHDSENLHPEISGSIKGIPSGFKAAVRESYSTRTFITRSRVRIVFWLVFTVGILSIGFGMGIKIFSDVKPSTSNLEDNPILILILVGIIYASMPAFLLWRTRRRYPKNLDVSD